MFGHRFGGISFVNVIQMLTETLCYHALGFTNVYDITLSTSDGVYQYITSLVVQLKLTLMEISPLGPRIMLVL